MTKDAGERSVTVERRGAVAILWLDRPAVLNAISLDLKAALIDALEELAGADAVGAAVLAGRGRAFSSGADLRLVAALREAPPDERAAAYALGTRLVRALLDAPVPIVAAVQGYAVGGGLSLVLAADMAIAAEGTVFFIPEVELGVPYLWGSTPLLAAAVGLQRARSLTLGCDRFDAAAAERWGIVRAVVPAPRLLDEALALAGRVAAMPRDAVAKQRRLNARLLRRTLAGTEDEIDLALGRA